MTTPLPTTSLPPAPSSTQQSSTSAPDLSDGKSVVPTPLTLESLGAKVDQIATSVASMQSAWAGLLQAPVPPPNPPLPASTVAAPATSFPYGMPHSGPIPLHLLQWPASPSPLPEWLRAQIAASELSSSTITTAFPSTHAPPATLPASVLPSASGVLYGGVDGPLFSGSPLPVATPATGPVDHGLAAFLATVSQGGPKFYKLEFATYDGSVDPLNWLNQCEQFFRGQQTPVSARTWLASYHLRDAAQTWYYALEQDEGMPSWERFRALCSLRFGPPVLGTRLAELARLPFGTTVQDFSERFNAVLCHTRDLSPRQKAELYVGGLPNHIRKHVQMRAPQDLQSAMYLARAFEDAVPAVPPPARGVRAPQRAPWAP